jgi:aspartate/methionine/tyrosine aminotransferase
MIKKLFSTRVLPRKSRDQLAIWSEFNQLSQKYGAINLSYGAPGLDPPPFLVENLYRASKEGFNQYTLFLGHPLLREKLSEFFSPKFKEAKNNQTLNPHTEILVTNGACEALYSTMHHIVEQGDEVIFFEPYYTQYVNYAEFAGASVKTAPLRLVNGKWEYDFDTLERMITPKTKAMMITNPHNPTGKLFTREELMRLTEIVEKHPQLIVVSDDVYYHLPYDAREHTLFANIGDNYKRTITVFSAGKMMNCTGWKVGWAIGPADLIKHVSYVHESAVFNINVPGQVAIARSLDETLKPYNGHKDYYAFVRNTF